MMRQSLEHACKGPVGKALQGKKVGHGSSSVFQDNHNFYRRPWCCANNLEVTQEGQSCGAVSGGQNVRHGSSTSGWDVGNPPTGERHPGDVTGEQGEKKGPSSDRPQEVETPSLRKETSTRQYFHDKAREVEERLAKEKKQAEEAEASKK